MPERLGACGTGRMSPQMRKEVYRMQHLQSALAQIPYLTRAAEGDRAGIDQLSHHAGL